MVWSASALTKTSSVPATRSRASIRSPSASPLAPFASNGRPTAKTLCVVIQGSLSPAGAAGIIAGDVPAVQNEFFAHVLGEPGHLHGAAGPRDIGVGRDLVAGRGDLVQGGHPVLQRVPQIGVVQGAQRTLPFLETARGDGFAFQVRAQHPGQFLGVSGLMDDDVAHRPGFAPGAGVGAALLHRICERLPFRESVVIDLSSHGPGIPTRTDKS